MVLIYKIILGVRKIFSIMREECMRERRNGLFSIFAKSGDGWKPRLIMLRLFIAKSEHHRHSTQNIWFTLLTIASYSIFVDTRGCCFFFYPFRFGTLLSIFESNNHVINNWQSNFVYIYSILHYLDLFYFVILCIKNQRMQIWVVLKILHSIKLYL